MRQTGLAVSKVSRFGYGRRFALSRALSDLSSVSFPAAMESFDSADLAQSFAPKEPEALVEQLPDTVAALQAHEPEGIFHEAAEIAESAKQNFDAPSLTVSTIPEIHSLPVRQSRIEEIEKSASNFLSAKTAMETPLPEVPRLVESEPANLLKTIDPVIRGRQSDQSNQPDRAELFADTGEDRSPAAWAAKLAGFGGGNSVSNRQAQEDDSRGLRRPALKPFAGAIEKTPDSPKRFSAKAGRVLSPLVESSMAIETATKSLSAQSDDKPPPIHHDGAGRNSDDVPPNVEPWVSAPLVKKTVPAVVRAAIENDEIMPSRFIKAVGATLPLAGKPLAAMPDLLSESELPEMADFQPKVESLPESFSAVGLADAVPQLQSADWPEHSADLRLSNVASFDAPKQQVGEETDWGGLPAPWEALPDWAASINNDERRNPEVSPSESLLNQGLADNAPKGDWDTPVDEAENSFAEFAGASQAMMSLAEPASSRLEIDLDGLAKQVYQRLKRRLAAERRREAY